MMDTMNIRVKDGFLAYQISSSASSSISYLSSLFSFRNFAKNHNTAKTWSKKRFTLFASSPQGIARLEEQVADERDQARKVIIPLNDCVKIWSPSTSLIEIITRSTGDHQLKVYGNDLDTSDWLLALQRVAFNLMQEKEEENQLYSGFTADDTIFPVTVIASPIKSLLEVGQFTIQLQTDSIVLLPFGHRGCANGRTSAEDGAIYTWSLRDIRRYGSSADTFTLEAGRRCASGPGLFSFSTPKGSYLFSMLSSYLRELMQKDKAMQGGRLQQITQPKESNTGNLTNLNNQHNHHQQNQPKKPNGRPLPPRSDEHSVSSLTPPPSPSTGGGNSLSSQSDNDYNPDYENILTLCIQGPPSRADLASSNGGQITPHYLQNEVEYAVVLKDKRK